MNVEELRAIMQEALRQEGLEARRLTPKVKAWSLPDDEIVRFFRPHAYRRPWGFVYSGSIGIEIPSLRNWLRANKSGKEGVFHSCFVSYLIVNEDVFRGFMVTHGDPVPADLWAGLLKDRLEEIPATVTELIAPVGETRKSLAGWPIHI